MINYLEEAKHFEELRYKLEGKMLCARLFRDIYIYNAFKSGERQRKIGDTLGKSESTIKHIIAERKK